MTRTGIKSLWILSLILLHFFFCTVKCEETVVEDHDEEVSTDLITFKFLQFFRKYHA